MKISNYDHSEKIFICVILMLIIILLIFLKSISIKQDILEKAFENGYEQVYDKDAGKVFWKKVK